ncbi:hypothetical protein HZB01_05050 [Candidatus Woesearchaeota archaeon]|nr:hypothetical protein [Candidatus Woesearchaeota archaeon]
MKHAMKYALIMIVVMLCAAIAISAIESGATISISLVNQDPDPALAGDTVEVRIGVENIGADAANNLMVEIVPSYPFEPVGEESAAQKITTLQGYQGANNLNLKILKYRVKVNKDARAGSYELKVKYYQEGSGAASEKTLSIAIQNRESAEIIHIDQTMLSPGKQSPLKFTINNVGNAPLRELTFHWDNDDHIILPVGSDNTQYIKYLDMGDSVDLQYQVIADTNAVPGLYKLNLYLSYDDSASNTQKNISSVAGVYVGGGTDFDVAFSENTNGGISFTIANIGNNPAYSVSIGIPEQRGWRVNGPSSVIIGNLNKGDYTVASFKLQSPLAGMYSQNRSGGMRQADPAERSKTADKSEYDQHLRRCSHANLLHRYRR